MIQEKKQSKAEHNWGGMWLEKIDYKKNKIWQNIGQHFSNKKVENHNR